MLSRAKVSPMLEIKHIESGYIQLVASPIGFKFSLNIAGLLSLIGFNFLGLKLIEMFKNCNDDWQKASVLPTLPVNY